MGKTTGLEVGYQVSVRLDDTGNIGLEALEHVEVDLQQGRQGDTRCGSLRENISSTRKRDILDLRKDVEEGVGIDGSGQAEMENITDRL